MHKKLRSGITLRSKTVAAPAVTRVKQRPIRQESESEGEEVDEEEEGEKSDDPPEDDDYKPYKPPPTVDSKPW